MARTQNLTHSAMAREARCSSSGRGSDGRNRARRSRARPIPRRSRASSAPNRRRLTRSTSCRCWSSRSRGSSSLVVFGLIVYAIVRYRRRPDDDGGEPAQVYGSTQVELAWTVTSGPDRRGPVAHRGARDRSRSRTPPSRPGRSTSPRSATSGGGSSAIPRWGSSRRTSCTCRSASPSSPTPTFLKLLSADVAHSFWVPRLAGKTDLIPNRVNEMWIEPEKPGLYLGQCAEYCGTQHAKMLLRVYVHTRDDFDRWVERAAPGRRRRSRTLPKAGGSSRRPPASAATRSAARSAPAPSGPTSRIS